MAVEITRTPSSNGNQKIWTWSAWVKKATVGMGSGDYQQLFTANVGNQSRYTDIYFREDYFEVFGGLYSTSSTSVDINVSTNRVFRDPSSFYHLVVAVDTTQSTAADRVKIYVNGVQETSLKNYQGSTVVYPGQNNNTFMNVTTAENRIGASGGSYPFKGLMTHIHFIDGTAYPASTFGETDSTSGIWKPKTAPSVTYGTNGFFLKFENSGNLDLDSSGNNHTFSTSGTLTQNVDTPSNNFAVMNPLDNYYTVNSFSNGNTTVTTPNSGYSGAIGGMGASAGKWYFEFKPISKTGDADEYAVGITGAPVTSTNQPHWKLATGYMYGAVNGNVFNNDSGATYGNTYTAGDIIGVAMDLDNNKLYFSKNGTFQNSGVPTSGSTGTGATSITAASSTITGFYIPCCAFSSNSYGAVMAFNFGSGYFQTTAVTSANADGNGIGAFEYSVPSGYYALCTKNIKEFG